MKSLMIAVFAVFASGLLFAETFSWRHVKNHSGSALPESPNWESFGVSSNWAVGEGGDGENPQNSVPGLSDTIYYGKVSDYKGKIACFDLGGDVHEVSRISGGGTQWVPYLMLMKNGTLSFLGSFTNNSTHVHVMDGGKFVHGMSCVSDFGKSEQYSLMHIHENGELDFAGTAWFISFQLLVDAGGKATFHPAKFAFSQSASKTSPASYIRNHGILDLPDGFVLNGMYTPSGPCVFTFEQKSGTLNLGGGFTKSEYTDGSSNINHADFFLAGGTVNVNNDVSFLRFRNVVMTNDAVATVNIAAGKVLDFTEMEFMPGSKLTKCGEGTVKLGSSVPDVLNIAEGIVEPTRAVRFKTLSFAEGGVLHIAVSGVSADNVMNAEKASITVTEEVLLSDKPIFRVFDECALKAMVDRIAAPEGFSVVANGGTLTIEKAHEPTEFVWKHKRSGLYYSFYDTTSWGVGKTIESENPGGWIPGEKDCIYYATTAGNVEYQRHFSFDMNGGSRWVNALSCGTEDPTWGFCNIKVKNGMLGFLSSFTNMRARVTVEAMGRFVLGDDCSTLMGYGGAQNSYTVNDGGECVIGGNVHMQIMHTSVKPGGKMTFRPASFAYDSNVSANNSQSYIRNSGTLEFPNGLTLGGASKGGCAFTVEQLDGDMLLGGDIVMADAVDYLDFRLSNGTLRVVNDAAFVGCRTVAMLGDASATVDVEKGKCADFSAMEFDTGTVVSKSGEGVLKLGDSAPDTLSVEKGSLVIGGAASFGEGLSFGEGSSLHFAAQGASADSIEGIDDVGVTMSESLLNPGTVLLESKNQDILLTIADKLGSAVAAKPNSRLMLSVEAKGVDSGVFELKVVRNPGYWIVVR